MSKDKKKKLTEKQSMIVRAVIFVIALGLAIWAFAKGTVEIGLKKPGYQNITADADEDAIMFAKGFDLEYWLDGSSNEIKRGINTLKSLYSPMLCLMYKQLDVEKEYNGMTNLATINAHIGEEIEVSDTLLEILKDAYARTLEEQGFNMFAGALYSHWRSILMLEDPTAFDPLSDADEAARIARLAEATSDLGNFRMTVTDEAKRLVRFDISSQYLELLREQEESFSIIDLNVMREAYIADAVCSQLEDRGYSNGYLCTPSGMIVSMSGHKGGEYCLYGFDGAAIVREGTMDIEPGRAYCGLRSFPLVDKERSYYSMPITDGVKGSGAGQYGMDSVLRGPESMLRTDPLGEGAASCYASVGSGSAVDACFICIRMYSAADTDEARKACGGTDDVAAFTVPGSGSGRVYTNAAGGQFIKLYPGILKEN